MKKLLSLIAFGLVAAAAWAQASLGFRGEDAASVGIYIKDLATGKVIAQNDPYRALLPASTMKSVTAATALQTLGKDFRFKTPIYLSGARSSQNPSIWEGNLIIESCGDPTIDSELFKDRTPMWREIANALKSKGISTITGSAIIIEEMPDDGCIPEWEIDDVPWAYGAGFYGFNFADNKYVLWPASGNTEPYVPDLDVTVVTASNHDMSRGINSSSIIVSGPNTTSPNWHMTPSMDNPAEVYIVNLEEKLANEGINFQNKDIDNLNKAEALCDHMSPPLSEMLQQMMYESHNLYAEGMLRAIAPKASRKAALEKERSFLFKIGTDPTYNKICDGSGLARADRLQAIFLSDLFEGMAKSENAAQYVELFPRAGVNGTVKSLLQKTRLQGKLALKSGSMNGVQCFAGYKLDNEEKPTHTVVILVNSFFCPRGELRGAIEKFLLDTFK